MRGSLGNVRRRVEALGRELKMVCQGPHSFLRLDNLPAGAAIPRWADEENASACGCGRPMKYRRVIGFFAAGSGAVASFKIHPAGR